jgi:hypothetical protein
MYFSKRKLEELNFVVIEDKEGFRFVQENADPMWAIKQAQEFELSPVAQDFFVGQMLRAAGQALLLDIME